MTLSLATKLKQFSNSPALSNPATSQAFLARQPGVAAAFGAGFLAPAVDAANERQQRLEFLLALDRAERDERRLDLAETRQVTQDALNQVTLNRLRRENDPAVIAQQQAAQAEQRALQNADTQSSIDLRSAKVDELEAKVTALESEIALNTGIAGRLGAGTTSSTANVGGEQLTPEEQAEIDRQLNSGQIETVEDQELEELLNTF